MKIERVIDAGRVGRLRQRVLRLPEICLERGYWMTQSYKETEGEPIVIRRAKALRKILQEMTVAIGQDELIVGRATTKERGAALSPELQWKWYLEEIDTISTREWDKFAPIPEEDKARMREFLPYWENKSLDELWNSMLPESTKKYKGLIGVSSASFTKNTHLAHACPDYERIINQGLDDYKGQVEDELAGLDLASIKDFEKFQFLSAVKITLEAAADFSKRYADLARQMAESETDVHRKAELAKIAGICQRVPANPASSFYEALQAVWFIYIILMMEGWGSGMNFGRPDQYLVPFYRKDIESGELTRDEARELIALLFIKLNGVVTARNGEAVKTVAGFPIHGNFALGGLTKDGRDAVNELSYLFLEAEEQIRLTGEDLIIRVHKNTPDLFLIKACEAARLLKGKLKFLSDETTIQMLLSDGKPIEYARDYIITGCWGPTVPGVSQDIASYKLNLPLVLELALNNGVSRLSGKLIGLQTGDARKFQSYEEVWNAYKKQFEAALPVLMLFRNCERTIFAQYAPTPFQSALYHGCLEKGLDITNGGTYPYLTHYTSLCGAPNVGDSLAAIKKTVFEDGKITMDQLLNALDKNFTGEEEVLQILKSAPKFGNDEDYVDMIVNSVLAYGSKEVSKYKGFAGAISNSSAAIVTANVPMGYKVGALPDGRKAGEPLSEGGISPHQGRNVSGPTATMRSVAKIDHLNLTGGSVLNMKLNPEIVKDEGKIRKFVTLIRTFCETGGFLVQFNIVDTATLRDAQKNPEKYRDLLIRVATYSAYFVELSPVLQNDIINRMEFEES